MSARLMCRTAVSSSFAASSSLRCWIASSRLSALEQTPSYQRSSNHQRYVIRLVCVVDFHVPPLYSNRRALTRTRTVFACKRANRMLRNQLGNARSRRKRMDCRTRTLEQTSPQLLAFLPHWTTRADQCLRLFHAQGAPALDVLTTLFETKLLESGLFSECFAFDPLISA